MPPLTPMLAKTVGAIPDGDYRYEPKWDGFRCLIFRDGPDLVLASRGTRELTRYFPELVEAARAGLPTRVVVDGEIIIRRPTPGGGERLDWDALTQRIHPAASRIKTLAQTTPASYVAFDLLAQGDEPLLAAPFRDRRARLQALFERTGPGLHLTRATGDPVAARAWFDRFEGAGLDGIVAKASTSPYTPGRRTMLKVKHVRTVDVVIVGYRPRADGTVGSLLVGLYDEAGQMRQVGAVTALPDSARRDLVGQLEPLRLRDAMGAPVTAEGIRSRFSGDRDVRFVPLRPHLVAEVRYDHLEQGRFRHTVQLVRWRPDRDPDSCTVDQLEVPARYDLGRVLTG